MCDFVLLNIEIMLVFVYGYYFLYEVLNIFR